MPPQPLRQEVEARLAVLEHRDVAALVPSARAVPANDPCSGAVTVSVAGQCHAPPTPAQEPRASAA